MDNLTREFEAFPEIEAVRIVEDVNYILQILLRNENENQTIFNLRSVEHDCEPGNLIRQSFQLALAPAIIILLFFSFTQRRQTFLVELCNGRPAFAYPMDIFTRRSRISYSCAFGSTVYVVYKVVFERFYAFPIGSALYERPLATVASTFIYGIVYIPIFICITVGTAGGYGVGSLYVWVMTGLELSNLIGCDIDIGERFILVAKRMPQLLCLLYLCIRLPLNFAIACRERHYTVKSMENLETTQCISSVKETYYGQRVMNLLKKGHKQNQTSAPVESSPMARIFSAFYQWEADFQFSSRLVTTLLVGAILLYQVAFETFAYGVSQFHYWLESLRHQLRLVDEAHLVDPTNITQRLKDVLEIGIDGITVFRILSFLSFVLAFLLGLFSILAALPSYRRYLRMIFRGDYSKFTSRGRQIPNQTRLAGCMRYAGYQVGYISWGFMIQSFVFLVISFLLTILILVFMYRGADWLLDLISLGWPVALIGIVVNFSQILSARYLFLQDRGNTFALTNRRLFFIATYFMFFYNIFMGVFSCLTRVIESLIFGLYLLPRLDHCVLPPSFRAIDPGYQAFIGFLMTESQHCHPVVLTFVHLVEIERQQRKGQQGETSLVSEDMNLDHVVNQQDLNIQLTHFEMGKDEEENLRRKAVVRFQWQLGYTLLNNPSVRMMRKGYLQAQEKAKALGLMLPISDGLPTAEADVIREQTKTYLAEQEAEKEKLKQNRRRRCRRQDKKHEDDSATLDESEKVSIDDELDKDEESLSANDERTLNVEGEGLGDENGTTSSLTDEGVRGKVSESEKPLVIEVREKSTSPQHLADVEKGLEPDLTTTERHTFTNPVV